MFKETRFTYMRDSDGVSIADLSAEDPQGATSWTPCASSEEELIILLKEALNQLTESTCFN